MHDQTIYIWPLPFFIIVLGSLFPHSKLLPLHVFSHSTQTRLSSHHHITLKQGKDYKIMSHSEKLFVLKFRMNVSGARMNTKHTRKRRKKRELVQCNARLAAHGRKIFLYDEHKKIIIRNSTHFCTLWRWSELKSTHNSSTLNIIQFSFIMNQEDFFYYFVSLHLLYFYSQYEKNLLICVYARLACPKSLKVCRCVYWRNINSSSLSRVSPHFVWISLSACSLARANFFLLFLCSLHKNLFLMFKN